MERTYTFDVIVVGGGHAGCEAAAAAARMGARTALVTIALTPLARCPATPPLAAWVRAFGPRDRCFGRPYGPGGGPGRDPVPLAQPLEGAGRAWPRTQADRKLYRLAMQRAIRETPNLAVIEGGVEDLIVTTPPPSRLGRVVGNPRRRELGFPPPLTPPHKGEGAIRRHPRPRG